MYMFTENKDQNLSMHVKKARYTKNLSKSYNRDYNVKICKECPDIFFIWLQKIIIKLESS